jgi:hypothetical protein
VILMPRFTSLSSVIASQIAQTVPNIKLPDGSANNTILGNTPLPSDFNVKEFTNVFRWGTSVWGIDDITNNYGPNIADGK